MLTFVKRLKTDEDCYKLLSKIKWPGRQFICAKCGNTTYHKGRSPYSRRCNRCKYDESVTAGTMFNKLKFPILTAFKIVYRMATTYTGNSSKALAEEFGIQKNTCLAFKHKIQQAMGAMQQERLTGDVQMCVGNVRKRSSQIPFWEPDPVVYIAIAVEVRNGKPGRGFAIPVEKEEIAALIPLIDRYVNPDARIQTVGQYGFMTKMKKRYKNISFVQYLPLLYEHFLIVQNWVSKECGNTTSDYLQCFLNEFYYHFNHHYTDWKSFVNLIRAMAKPE